MYLAGHAAMHIHVLVASNTYLCAHYYYDARRQEWQAAIAPLFADSDRNGLMPHLPIRTGGFRKMNQLSYTDFGGKHEPGLLVRPHGPGLAPGGY
jgi:hypothetical protein